MDVSTKDRGVYLFGPFRLDPTHRSLWRDGTEIKLAGRLFETLLYLVENPGRVIEKDELISAVWRDRIVEEGNLTQAISALRKVLHVEGAAGPMIATVSGRGYSLAVAVRLDTGAAYASAPAASGLSTTALPPRDAAHTTASPRARRWHRSPALRAAAGAVLVALAAGTGALWRGAHHPAAEAPAPAFAPPQFSVGVLPFANIGGTPSQTYLSDGLSEEVILSLGQLDRVLVAARTSSFTFRNSNLSAGEIARRLNVATVLEGSIRWDGPRMRITATLIDGRTGYQLWSHGYDREQGDVLHLQAEIAGSVTQALRLTLGAGEASRLALGGTSVPAAYDAFLHGMGALAMTAAGGQGAQEEARSWFGRAVALDPAYAQAHAALAHQLSWLANAGATGDAAKAHQMTDQALAEAKLAIQLAPDLADGYAALAFVQEDALAFTDAWQAAQRAATLDPGNASVLRFYGQIASRMGHFDEGWAAEQRSVALDPLSPRSYFGMAVVSLIDRRYDDVLQNLDRVKAITGKIGPIALQLSTVVALKRQHYDQALKLADGFGDWPHDEYRAIALHALGRQSEADAAFAALHKEMGDNGSLQFAEVYAQWGQPARALAALEDAYRLRDPGLIELRSSSFLDPVRGTPQYASLIARLHFPH